MYAISCHAVNDVQREHESPDVKNFRVFVCGVRVIKVCGFMRGGVWVCKLSSIKLSSIRCGYNWMYCQ